MNALMTAAVAILAGGTILVPPRPGSAAEFIEFSVKDHRLSPTEVTVPAGQKFRIEVTNQDDTPEEFESHELKVEKIIVGGGKISVLAGPLEPGSYKVFGDYHPDTAVATVTAVKKD